MGVAEPEALPARARSNWRLAGWLTLVGLLSLANFISNATSSPPDDFVYLWSSVANALLQFTIMLGIILGIAGRGQRRAMFAWRRPNSWWRGIGLGAALVVGVFLFVAVTSPLLHPGKEQGLTPTGWDGSRAPQFFANLAVIAGFVPFVEESMFRGLGYTLLRRFGQWPAIVLVGIFFALVHGLPEGIPVLTFFGMGLAYIRVRTGSIYPCMAVHATFNAISLVVAVVA